MNRWDVLGIEPTTDKRVIKRAYAKMLAKYHPEEFPEKFVEINRAYQWALTYHDGEIDSAFLFIESSHEPDVSLEATSEFADTAESYFIFENDITSIFVSGADFEAITEETQQAEKALEEFRLVLCVPVGTLWHDIKGAWLLNIYMRCESFMAVRRNPVYIDGLVNFLSYWSYIYFSVFHVFVLRRALGISKKTDAHRYPSGLDAALTRLDARLKTRVQYHISRVRAFFIRIGVFIAIIIVIWLAAVALINAFNRVLNGPPSSIVSSITESEHPTWFPALQTHLSPSRQTSTNLYLVHAYFEAHIRPSPSMPGDDM